MQELKESLEARFGCKLEETYSSREDDNEDEELGHFISYEIEPGFELSDEIKWYPPILNLYESGKLQFFRDATPYPVKENTADEVRQMAQALCPFPVRAELVTRRDYCEFMISILEQG